MDLSTGTSLRNVAPFLKGAWLKKHSKVSNPATNTTTILHNHNNPLRTPAPAPPRTDPPDSKLQGNQAPQKHLSKIEKIKLKLKLSDEVKMKRSGDVAKSTVTPSRRQPTHTRKLEDNQEDSLPEEMTQGVQKKQKEKLNVKTVRFDKVDDNVVEFRSNRIWKTATLHEDVQPGRQPVVQDNHCSIRNTNTAVQAMCMKNPQENSIPKKLIEDRSALQSSSALLLPTQMN